FVEYPPVPPVAVLPPPVASTCTSARARRASSVTRGDSVGGCRGHPAHSVALCAGGRPSCARVAFNRALVGSRLATCQYRHDEDEPDATANHTRHGAGSFSKGPSIKITVAPLPASGPSESDALFEPGEPRRAQEASQADLKKSPMH